MADQPSHHILLYEYVEDMAERRGPHREAHLARIKAEQDGARIGKTLAVSARKISWTPQTDPAMAEQG